MPQASCPTPQVASVPSTAAAATATPAAATPAAWASAAGASAAGAEAARHHAARPSLRLAEDALAGLRGPLGLWDDHARHHLLIDLHVAGQQFTERAVSDAKLDVDLLQLRRRLRWIPRVDRRALRRALHGLEEFVDFLRV